MNLLFQLPMAIYYLFLATLCGTKFKNKTLNSVYVVVEILSLTTLAFVASPVARYYLPSLFMGNYAFLYYGLGLCTVRLLILALLVEKKSATYYAAAMNAILALFVFTNQIDYVKQGMIRIYDVSGYPLWQFLLSVGVVAMSAHSNMAKQVALTAFIAGAFSAVANGSVFFGGGFNSLGQAIGLLSILPMLLAVATLKPELFAFAFGKANRHKTLGLVAVFIVLMAVIGAVVTGAVKSAFFGSAVSTNVEYEVISSDDGNELISLLYGTGEETLNSGKGIQTDTLFTSRQQMETVITELWGGREVMIPSRFNDSWFQSRALAVVIKPQFYEGHYYYDVNRVELNNGVVDIYISEVSSGGMTSPLMLISLITNANFSSINTILLNNGEPNVEKSDSGAVKPAANFDADRAANTLNSSRFNLFNDGLTAAMGDYPIFYDPDMGGVFWLNEDGVKCGFGFDGLMNIRYIDVAGDMIYFATFPDYGQNEIRSYNTTTREMRTLAQATGTYLQECDGYLFFMQDTWTNPSIWRMTVDGGDKREIYSGALFNKFAVDKETEQIVCFRNGDGVPSDAQWIDLDGNFKITETGFFACQGYDVLDYTIAWLEALTSYRVMARPDSGDRTTQASSSDAISALNYYEGKFYYAKSDGIYAKDLSYTESSGDGVKLMTATNVNKICIANGVLFAYTRGGDLLTLKLDGIRPGEDLDGNGMPDYLDRARDALYKDSDNSPSTGANTAAKGIVSGAVNPGTSYLDAYKYFLLLLGEGKNGEFGDTNPSRDTNIYSGALNWGLTVDGEKINEYNDISQAEFDDLAARLGIDPTKVNSEDIEKSQVAIAPTSTPTPTQAVLPTPTVAPAPVSTRTPETTPGYADDPLNQSVSVLTLSLATISLTQGEECLIYVSTPDGVKSEDVTWYTGAGNEVSIEKYSGDTIGGWQQGNIRVIKAQKGGTTTVSVYANGEYAHCEVAVAPKGKKLTINGSDMYFILTGVEGDCYYGSDPLEYDYNKGKNVYVLFFSSGGTAAASLESWPVVIDKAYTKVDGQGYFRAFEPTPITSGCLFSGKNKQEDIYLVPTTAKGKFESLERNYRLGDSIDIRGK